MSTTTMTMTVPVLPPASLSTAACCPSCGTDLSLAFSDTFPAPSTMETTPLVAAQAQIDDLQAQVRLLNAKATAAVDRWADYEDELAALRKELTTSREHEATGTSTTPQTPTVTTTVTTSPTSPRMGSPGMGFAAAATNRISALLSRKSTPNLKARPASSSAHHPVLLLPTPSPSGGFARPHTSYSTSALTPPTSAEDLLDALTREQQLRLAAEAKFNDTSREVEELSVSLFEEANEMVATERREKAVLEERVGELERRDREKKVRLEKLEGAMGRIERVRNLLGEKDAPRPVSKE